MDIRFLKSHLSNKILTISIIITLIIIYGVAFLQPFAYGIRYKIVCSQDLWSEYPITRDLLTIREMLQFLKIAPFDFLLIGGLPALLVCGTAFFYHLFYRLRCRSGKQSLSYLKTLLDATLIFAPVAIGTCLWLSFEFLLVADYPGAPIATFAILTLFAALFFAVFVAGSLWFYKLRSLWLVCVGKISGYGYMWLFLITISFCFFYVFLMVLAFFNLSDMVRVVGIT